MITGDNKYIKKINKSITLQKIIEYKSITRTSLAKVTGLNKATITVQVNELLEEQLIKEEKSQHRGVGRRPINLSINESAGYVLGIDLDYDYIMYILSDLKGEIVHSHKEAVHSRNYHEVVNMLINQIENYQNMCENSSYGLTSAVIGIHGIVNKEQQIHFVPKYEWYNKKLKNDINKKIPGLSIYIENNANLSSYAEKVFNFHKYDKLLTITLTSGIGTGYIVGGKIYRGFHGFAGETGHIIIHPDGKQCKCGNKGCWELYASETALFNCIKENGKENNIVKNILKNQVLLRSKYRSCLDSFVKNLALGLNNIINVANPEILILNSRILSVYPNILEEIKDNLKSSVTQCDKFVISNLGDKACAMGAYALGIRDFLDVREIYLTR